MEWLIFLAVVVLAATFVAWPRHGDELPVGTPLDDLRARRETLLAELREVDDDALAGRITADDRRDARRLLGVQLREVSDALRDLGEAAAPRERSSGASS